MGNIGLIFKRELASYVRTPSGYVIAAIALIAEGVIFNVWGLHRDPDFSENVLYRFLGGAAFVTLVLVALISMKLLAAEKSNGVQTLLFTSPVHEYEIVLGKYLGGLVFVTAVVLLTIYLPALIFVNGKVSINHIAIGYLGILLLGAAALAVATLASALAPNPFVAVLLAALFLALMEGSYFIGEIASGYGKSALPWFANWMSHYMPSFSKGLFRLSDVAFFMVVTYVSLLGATRVLQSQRWQ